MEKLNILFISEDVFYKFKFTMGCFHFCGLPYGRPLLLLISHYNIIIGWIEFFTQQYLFEVPCFTS